MAKKTKGKDVAPQRIVPNKWVYVAGTSGHACSECGRSQSRGMMWVDGAVKACKACGRRIARVAA